MAYSINALQDDCYPGTTVLVNKLGLKDQGLLNQAEELSVSVNYTRIYTEMSNEPLTFDFYKRLHRRLFETLYDWAGELRKVNLYKKGTAFCPAEQVESVGMALFSRLEDERYFLDLPRERYITEISEFYHDLNILHPFREGNGRTQRLFFTLLIERAGYRIDFASRDPDELIMATVYAAQGVLDHLYSYFGQVIDFEPAERQGSSR